MHLLSEIPVYFDPFLRSHDRTFTTYIDSLIQEFDFKSVTALEANKSGVPFLVIYHDLPKLPADFNTDNAIFVYYQGANLDLLKSAEKKFDTFEVSNVLEFQQLWPLIQDALSCYLNKAEYLFAKNNSYPLKKIFSKQNMESLKNVANDVRVFNFRMGLLTSGNIENAMLFVRDFFREEHGAEGGLDQVAKLMSLSGTYESLPLGPIDEHLVFLWWKGEIKEVPLYYYFIEEFIENLRPTMIVKKEEENWEDIKNTLETPILLIDKFENILSHNKAFIDLNFSLKACLELEHNQQVPIEDKLYRVIKNKDEEGSTSFIFFPVDELLVTSSRPSNEELGIISSSIAHELNNPLGGVMAAVDYLLLEIEDSTIVEQLKDMKEGVSRCKKLVETFLGFSRYQPLRGDNVGNVFILESSVKQAMELMRFRLIENNFSMNINLPHTNEFAGKLNPYIASMIFYLVFGEIVTASSHYHLIKNQKLNTIDLKISESAFRIDIELNEDLNFSQKILSSKLIKHLCEMENIRLYTQKGNALSLIYTPKDAS